MIVMTKEDIPKSRKTIKQLEMQKMFDVAAQSLNRTKEDFYSDRKWAKLKKAKRLAKTSRRRNRS